MWLMTRLAIIFYVSVLWVTSLTIILFILHILDFETVKYFLYLAYSDHNLRLVIFSIACGFILVSLLLENLIYGRRHMERTIAFDNTSGRVTVSLTAIEDVIKSLTSQLPQIREIKPFLTANKKGIDAQVKLVLRSAVNIPDLTSRLQDMIRRKIEESVGMEGKINIRIHIAKMFIDELKLKRSQDIGEQPQVPFHGYRV